MATYATPPNTIYDEANLRLVQNWAKPMLDFLEMKRQKELRDQMSAEAMARELRGYDFAEGQQRRAFAQQDKAEDKKREDRKKDEAETRKIAENTFKTANARRRALVSQLKSASIAAQQEIENNAIRYAQSMIPGYKATDPQMRADFERYRLEALVKPIISRDTQVKLALLEDEYSRMNQATKMIWDESLKMGLDLTPMLESGDEEVFSSRPSASDPLALPKPGGDKAANLRSPDSERPPGPNTMPGVFPKAGKVLSNAVNELNTTVESNLRPAANAYNNAMGYLFGGEYVDPLMIMAPTERANDALKTYSGFDLYAPPSQPSRFIGPPIAPNMMQLPTGEVVPMLDTSIPNILFNQSQQQRPQAPATQSPMAPVLPAPAAPAQPFQPMNGNTRFMEGLPEQVPQQFMSPAPMGGILDPFPLLPQQYNSDYRRELAPAEDAVAQRGREILERLKLEKLRQENRKFIEEMLKDPNLKNN